VPPGKPVEVALLRGGKERVVKVTTELLQRAQGDPVELKDWGMAVSDITRMMALERNRKSTAGVLIDSIRGGSGAATAKMPLQSDDVILQVAGEPVDNIAGLKKVTAKQIEGKTDRVSVLVLFERDTKQCLTVVKIGKEEERNRPASAAKPWSSLSTQVLTSDLTESLDMAGQRGVRVTEVFKGQAADRAGVKVGDLILQVNGRQVQASLPGDGEVFETMIRRLPLGGKAKLKIVRGGKPIEITMALEPPPISDDDVKQMTDTDFEFSARELSYTDRVNQQIPEGLQGVLLQKVETGGVASLGGLRGNDFVMSVDDKTISSVDDLKAALDQIRQDKPRRVVFFVRRGIHTLYCEVEPDYPE
jgi:S1-C subfamily serine protease